MDEIWMMTPDPLAIIDGNRPRSNRTAGNRFSLKACCHNSSVTVMKPPLGADDPPTLLTSMSTPAKRSITSRITCSVPRGVDKSDAMKCFGSRSGFERAVTMIVAPLRRKRSAIAFPAPCVPPVTRTRLPENSFGSQLKSVDVFINAPSTSVGSITKHSVSFYIPDGMRLSRENETRILVIQSSNAMKSKKATKTTGPGRPRSDQARHDILKAAYTLLRAKGVQAVGALEIAKAAGVSSATIYRWWNSKEEILFDACFEHMKPVLAISSNGSALARLRRYVLRATDFLTSEDAAIMTRLVTGIHHDKKLRRMFLERYVGPRRKIQRGIIEEAIASGELKQTTDPELLIDALNGPLFFRWLQGHAPLDRGFADRIFDKVIHAFEGEAPQGRRR